MPEEKLKMKKVIKAYKAFNPDMTCNGFQYKEGESYKTDKAQCCTTGFHSCKNPLDVFSYYDITNCILREVEASGKIDTHKEDSKISSTEIKIGSKLDLKSYIKVSIDFLFLICKSKKQLLSGYYSTQASSGDSSKQASSGDYSKQASSGDSSTQASSGYSSTQASSGDYSTQASSGDSSKQASSGDYSKQASSGDYSKQASSGDYSKQASNGYSSKQASSGYSSKQASSGDYSTQASSGDSSTQASSGDYSTQASSGDYSKQASSGDYSKQATTGKYCVMMSAGNEGIAKGKIGSWIALSEWKIVDNIYKPVCVKAVQIDGKEIKEDTFYMLKDGNFIEI